MSPRHAPQGFVIVYADGVNKGKLAARDGQTYTSELSGAMVYATREEAENDRREENEMVLSLADAIGW